MATRQLIGANRSRSLICVANVQAGGRIQEGLPAAQPINVAQQGLDIITVTRNALAASPAPGVERGVLVVLRCLG